LKDGRVIVVSAINIVDGGMRTILDESINHFRKIENEYKIVYLVSQDVADSYQGIEGIEFVSFPLSRRSWLFRLYYEYIGFKRWQLSAGYVNVFLWLSLHDTTPNVFASRQAVYCHNAVVFLKLNIRHIFLAPRLYIVSLLYKYIYRLGIRKNKKVIVQQHWFGDFFQSYTNRNCILVARPHFDLSRGNFHAKAVKSDSFFYPAFPRVFKNHMTLVNAFKSVPKSTLDLTLSGNENRISQAIQKFCAKNTCENVRFLGRMSRDETLSRLAGCKALIFPSTLESWGLPISEAVALEKTVLLPDLPYAREAAGDYCNVYWFDPYLTESIVDAVGRYESGASPDGATGYVKKYDEVITWDEILQELVS
jgi:glycosyltransferase involved in cell wall biosynthesis